MFLNKTNNLIIMTYYDQIAQGYDELHKKEQLTKLKIIKKHIIIHQTDKLLDVGCGTGVSTEFWQCDITGIDPSNELQNQNKENKTAKYLHASAEDIPFPDHSFDIVISITAIHNFLDPKKGLEEIKRVGTNKFVLTLLKRASNYSEIKELIESMFILKTVIHEDKDEIYIVG